MSEWINTKWNGISHL